MGLGTVEFAAMTDIEPEEDLPPVAHVVLVYTGPVAPHWEMKIRYGDERMLDDFWNRVGARLLLLPKHDPQFRRNRERVNRDAERERIICDWDLGENDAESTVTAVAPPPGAEVINSAPIEAPVDADAPDASEAGVDIESGSDQDGDQAESEVQEEVQEEAEVPEEAAASEEVEIPAESEVDEEAEGETAGGVTAQA